MAVQAVLGAKPAWHSEVDANASKILEHHWPEVPNLGDLTKLDWSEMGRKPDLPTTYAMYDRYCQGLSLEAVGAEFRVSRQTVYTRFKRRGLDMRPRPAARQTVEWSGQTYSLRDVGYYAKTSGDRSYLHRDVWKHHYGDIPDGCDIHHVDHDKMNNDIANLAMLDKAEHTRLHAAEAGDALDSPVDIVTAGYP
jgi:hypothetical protein